MTVDLPESVLDLVEYNPFEDALLYILREKLPDVPAFSLIPLDTDSLDFFVIARRDHAFGQWGGTESRLDEGRVWVHVFTRDPDGDQRGALISEAIRVVMREAWKDNLEIPDLGCWVHKVKLADEPSRKTDWATSTGPVQFADLPQGYWRYESKYDLLLRYRDGSE